MGSWNRYCCIGVFTTIYLLIGIVLSAVGVRYADSCPAEPVLPAWMILAGVALIGVMVLVYVLTSIMGCVDLHFTEEQHRNGETPSWRFCLLCCFGGVMGVLGFFLLLGLWLGGTYYTLRALQKTPRAENVKCDISILVVAGVSVVAGWFGLVSVCARTIYDLWCKKNKDDESIREETRLQRLNHVYDPVSTR